MFTAPEQEMKEIHERIAHLTDIDKADLFHELLGACSTNEEAWHIFCFITKDYVDHKMKMEVR